MNSLYRKNEYSELFKYSPDFEQKFCNINSQLNTDYYFVIPKVEYNGISLENIVINNKYVYQYTPLSTPRSVVEGTDEDNGSVTADVNNNDNINSNIDSNNNSNNNSDENNDNNNNNSNNSNSKNDNSGDGYESDDSYTFNSIYNYRGGVNNIDNKPSIYKLKECIDNTFVTLFERNMNTLLEEFISLSFKDKEINELFVKFKNEFESKYTHIIRNKKEVKELTIFLQNIHHRSYEDLAYTQRVKIVSILFDYVMNMKDFAKLITSAVFIYI